VLEGSVQPSPIGGLGIFANRDFKEGEILCRMRGEPISIADLEQLYRSGDMRITCDPYQLDEHTYINLEKPYLYINHSCDPNAAIKGVDTLVAVRSISKGTEITYDYSAMEWTPCEYVQYDSTLWPLRCKCGSQKCRKIITCFPYLPSRTRLEYLERGVIEDFILRKILGSTHEQRCLTCEKILNFQGEISFSDTEKEISKRLLRRELPVAAVPEELSTVS